MDTIRAQSNTTQFHLFFSAIYALQQATGLPSIIEIYYLYLLVLWNVTAIDVGFFNETLEI